MKTNYNDTAVDRVRDKLFGIAEDIVNDKYGDTIKSEEKDKYIESEYDALIEYIKENL